VLEKEYISKIELASWSAELEKKAAEREEKQGVFLDGVQSF